MAERPSLRSVGTGGGPDPFSVLFQKLSADYPDLSRRAVGDVLDRVCRAGPEFVPEPVRVRELETAARGLLDVQRVRAADALRRIRSAAGPPQTISRSPFSPAPWSPAPSDSSPLRTTTPPPGAG